MVFSFIMASIRARQNAANKAKTILPNSAIKHLSQPVLPKNATKQQYDAYKEAIEKWRKGKPW